MGQLTDAQAVGVFSPSRRSTTGSCRSVPLLLSSLLLSWDNGLTPSIDQLIELDPQVRPLHYYYNEDNGLTQAGSCSGS